MKRTILLAAAALIVAAPVLAFHDSGVAHCNGCHTMHNSEDGVAMVGNGLPVGQGNPSLLFYLNKTDVCLECHAGDGGYHVWSTDELAPSVANRGGGDFVFLEEDNVNDGHGGASNPIPGHTTGHSVISDMMGTVADGILTAAPGGTYPASEMACSSCHDPHGTEAFRLLYQAGQYVPGVGNWTATMVAEGIGTRAGDETQSSHNAYIDGYSEWCASCHSDFHGGWSAQLIHPSGQVMSSFVRAKYESYNGTSDCIANPGTTGPCGTGTPGTSYLDETPFQDAAMTMSWTAGPTSSSEVICATCHRAHATSAQNAGRWDFTVTGLSEDGHESGSYAIPNPYDSFQRSLCNKCHTKDEYDEPVDFAPAP